MYMNLFIYFYIYIYIYIYIHIYIYVYILIFIYRRYDTITDVYTTALLQAKPLSYDDFGLRHGFGAETSLPLAQCSPAVSYETTSLCQTVVSVNGIARSTMLQLEPYLGPFPCISSCLMEEV